MSTHPKAVSTTSMATPMATIGSDEYSLLGALGSYLVGMKLTANRSGKSAASAAGSREFLVKLSGELRSPMAKAVACVMVKKINVPQATKAIRCDVSAAKFTNDPRVEKAAGEILDWSHGPGGTGTGATVRGAATSRKLTRP